MSEAIIRDAAEADFDRILELNLAELEKTSAMDGSRLSLLDQLACYHRVAVVEGEVTAFLLAMCSGAIYRNDNYDWFTDRYSNFLYVDRIVVGKAWLGKKIGGALYHDLFTFARERDIEQITCEYNLDPPNLASKYFHDRFGFREVGQQEITDTEKRVSLQLART